MTSLMSQEERRLVIQQGGFADIVVKAAAACNQLVIDNCGMCTVYCDKQVQYESVLEQYKMTSPLEGLFSKLDNSMEVQVCRDDLFDETSVVDQVNSRTEDD
jgi:hypothetical protein